MKAKREKKEEKKQLLNESGYYGSGGGRTGPVLTSKIKKIEVNSCDASVQKERCEKGKRGTGNEKGSQKREILIKESGGAGKKQRRL